MPSPNASSGEPSYRGSHAAQGYGEHYSRTYETGYYAELWRGVEAPLLEDIFCGLASIGARSYLDFACGTGRITAVGERFFEHSVGVDVSDAMLEVARGRCSKASLMKVDLTRNDLGSQFDVITAFRFFLNAEPDLRLAAAQAIRRHLRPDGRAVVNVHVNRASILGRAYELRNRLRGKRVANTLSLDAMREVIDAAAMQVDSVHWYGLYPRTGWRLGRMAQLLIRPTETVFERVPLIPRGLAQCFLLVCSPLGPRPA